MAKTAKLKKNSQSTSIHSRAAKRATSPSLNLDKSLTSIKPPPETPNHRPAVLAAQHGSGVKKSKKGKSMSRQQRRRQEKGMERAEIVMDKTEKKVHKSLGRGKTVKDRRAAWEELNGKLSSKSKEQNMNDGDNGDDVWQDEEMVEDTVDDGAPDSSIAAITQPAPVKTAENVTGEADDEDEIL
ncbi:MAG: hypothetical protein M1819_000304 [Sarea resinae]|nr:MAG: hypothetical protein M1819_000304 [Sarea resinae]